jgi:hypothetical protein
VKRFERFFVIFIDFSSRRLSRDFDCTTQTSFRTSFVFIVKTSKRFLRNFFFLLFIMKLKCLINNDVMIKFRLRISSFRRLFDFRVFFIRIIFDFKVDRIFLHSFDFCHEIYDDSKHQVIIQYCIRRRIIDSFERVISFFTDASIIFVLCRFWVVDWDSCFATMNHDVEWIRKKSF